MGQVPREIFVPEDLRHLSYEDGALPIGLGQTISQPYMVAAICTLLDLSGDERVLDVGTGSGYQAAVLSKLAREVVTIERVPELAARAEDGATRGRLCERRAAGRRRVAGRARPSAVRRDRRRGCRSGHSPGSLRTAPKTAVGWSSLAGVAGDRSSCSSRERPTGRSSGGRFRAGSCRFSARRGSRVADPSGGGSRRPPTYPGVPVDSAAELKDWTFARPRGRSHAQSRHNWEQLVKFCVVGGTGYVVNLAVYVTFFVADLGVHYIPAARVLVPRRRDEQLHLEPDLDVPRAARATSPSRA